MGESPTHPGVMIPKYVIPGKKKDGEEDGEQGGGEEDGEQGGDEDDDDDLTAIFAIDQTLIEM